MAARPLLSDSTPDSLPQGVDFLTYKHNTALILGDVEIGEGSFIGAYCVLTDNIKIGKHSILNRACHIGHDSVCGDYLSMMPASIISGNCTLGDRVYIGTNSSIREKIHICDDATIGLNSGVVKDIYTPNIYAGVPANTRK